MFRGTDGDLPSLHAALIDVPEAWSPEAWLKFKTPHEFVVSALRMFDFVPAPSRQLIAPFDLLGQRPYTPGSPAGWPDIASRWDGPDALLNRIEWSSQLAERRGQAVRAVGSREHGARRCACRSHSTSASRARKARRKV